MRIFFLSQRVPYPPNRGDKIPAFHEIRHLSRRHEVSVFCLGDGEADMANVDGLSSIVHAVHAVPLDRRAAQLRALLALASGQCLSVAYFRERRLHEILREAVAQNPPDLFLVFSSGMAQYVEPFTDIYRIMQYVDLDSLKWKLYAGYTAFPKSWVYRIEAKRLLDYESRIARSFDHSVVCTEPELRDFEKLIPGASVSCVGNGVDLEAFRPSQADKEPGSILFLGVMDYFPNIDAMAWFCEDILPRVRNTVPAAKLIICGSRPTKEVQALGRNPGVTVTGFVDSVKPYLDRAQVSVAPMRLGRGIQNKVLEAMASGLPCVATSLGFSGIRAAPGRDLMVADTAEEIAAAIVALLTDETARRRMAARAREAMETAYSWDKALEDLDKVVDRHEVLGSDFERTVTWTHSA